MRQPNVLIILTDDQGYGDTSKTGNKNLSTPFIDNLEELGAKMENFYTCPLCAPTRAEILTGRQSVKTGVHGVTQKAEYLNLDETTIGDIFKASGYKTSCFGKWHSGSLYPYHPNARGFDEFYGFCCGHWGYYFNTVMDHNGNEVRGNGYIIDDITNHAIDWIDENSNSPFLCYLAYNTPHSPYQVPDEFYDKFKDFELISKAEKPQDENIDITRAILAMCENTDHNIGRVLQKLSEKNLDEDTIIIFLSDNGPTGTVRFNCGLKGQKGGVDEGSVKTACSFTWKNHIPKGIAVKQISSTTDILPTITSLCGIEYKPKKEIDGIDLSKYLLNRNEPLKQRDIYALQFKGNSCSLSVRNQSYRYILDNNELYDIENDYMQKYNIIDKQPKIANELRQSCENFKKDFIPEYFETRYLTIGYDEQPKSYLNAQDGEPTGAITWSSIHPNCSYFINWDNDKDVINWHIQANKSGMYSVTLMYTCSQSSVGKVLKVSSNHSECSHQIDKAFEPELDQDLDRVLRNESYTKKFAQQYIGNVYIEKGENNIKLSCVDNFNELNICDVRTLLVELI